MLFVSVPLLVQTMAPAVTSDVISHAAVTIVLPLTWQPLTLPLLLQTIPAALAKGPDCPVLLAAAVISVFSTIQLVIVPP